MRAFLLFLLLAGPAVAADQCLGVDPQASTSIRIDDRRALPPLQSGVCHVRISPTGYPLPDRECTPGAINPTVMLVILQNPAFRTKCVRDGATTPAEKRSTYADYRITKPAHNSGKTQTCELDHLVSLELGGADTLDNLWPQCGPAKAQLAKRWFKIKDTVENYLAVEVKAGHMALEEAQRGIAEDWSQYVPIAKKN